MGGMNASHVGRCVFASVFLLAALHKLSMFDISTGGSRVVWEGTSMGTRMDEFISRSLPLHQLLQGSPTRLLQMLRPWYPTLFLGATVMELVGSVALMMNKPLGAKMLLFFLAMVTMVMHPVIDEDQRMECLKNMSLGGGLIMYLSSYM